MSGNKSQLPSPQLNLDDATSNHQSSEAVLPPQRVRPRRNTVPILLDDRIAALWDREIAACDRAELRHKFGD